MREFRPDLILRWDRAVPPPIWILDHLCRPRPPAGGALTSPEDSPTDSSKGTPPTTQPQQSRFRFLLRQYVHGVLAVVEIIEAVAPHIATLDDPKHFADFSGVFDKIPREDRKRFAQIVDSTFSQNGPETRDGTPQSKRALTTSLAVFVKAILDEFGLAAWVVDIFEAIDKQMSRVPRLPIVYRGMLTNLVSTFEILFGEIVREYYRRSPGALGAAQEFSLRDLQQLTSIDEALAVAIDRRVDALMFQSFDSWIAWYEKSFGFSLTKHALDWNRLSEVIQRRHVVIHNAGKVSRQYLDRVEGVEQGLSVGDMLHVDSAYLEDAVDECLVVGIRALMLSWGKLEPEEKPKMIDAVHSTVTTLMSERRWRSVEALASSLFQWDASSYGKEVARTNRFLAQKRRNGLDGVRREIENWDVSALALEFHLVKAALADNVDLAFEIMPRVILSESVDRNSFYSWPVLEELRSDPRFLEVMSSTKEQQDAEAVASLPASKPEEDDDSAATLMPGRPLLPDDAGDEM